MTDIPKCTSWRGHKFEGRYSIQPLGSITFKEFGVDSMTELTFFDLAQLRQGKTYERDICVRCGLTVERHPAPKPPETQA